GLKNGFELNGDVVEALAASLKE
ncbi:unnamed protein product, partial [Didymodactylos carnosus]